jgi:hypothetical protein
LDALNVSFQYSICDVFLPLDWNSFTFYSMRYCTAVPSCVNCSIATLILGLRCVCVCVCVCLCVCIDELPSCLQCIIDFTCMSFHVSVTVRNKISRISHTVLSCTFLYFVDWLMCQLSKSFILENRLHIYTKFSGHPTFDSTMLRNR